jgi:hypothetical protein
MGPRMWRIYTTNLTGSFINDIDVIPQDRITCLYNIRVLTIDERAEECSRDSRLASLLHLLRDNQLLEFNNATERPLHMKLFFHLLRHQSNLKSLRVRLDMSSAVDEDTTLWSTELTFLLTSALSSLKTLRIYIGDDSGSGHQENNLYKHEMAFDNILMQRACRLKECVRRTEFVCKVCSSIQRGPICYFNRLGASLLPAWISLAQDQGY